MLLLRLLPVFGVVRQAGYISQIPYRCTTFPCCVSQTASGLGSLINAAMGALPWVINGAVLSPMASGFMALFPPLGGAMAFDQMVRLNFREEGLPLSGFVTGGWPLIASMLMWVVSREGTAGWHAHPPL